MYGAVKFVFPRHNPLNLGNNNTPIFMKVMPSEVTASLPNFPKLLRGRNCKL
jgi:hypothetical protein